MNNFPKSLLSLLHSPVWTIPKLPFTSKIKVQALSAWHLRTSMIWPLPHFPPWLFLNSCQNDWNQFSTGLTHSWSCVLIKAFSSCSISTKTIVSDVRDRLEFHLLREALCFLLPTYSYSISSPTYKHTSASCFSLPIPVLIPEEHESKHSCPLSPPYLTIPLFLLPQIKNVQQ